MEPIAFGYWSVFLRPGCRSTETSDDPTKSSIAIDTVGSSEARGGCAGLQDKAANSENHAQKVGDHSFYIRMKRESRGGDGEG